MLTLDQALTLLPALRQEGQRAQAQALGQALLAAFPTHPAAIRLWGGVCYDDGRYHDAAVAFQSALDQGQLDSFTLGDWQNFADAMMILGQRDGAEAALHQALAKDGANSATWNLVAQLLLLKDQTELALAAARRALACQPQSPAAYRAAAQALLSNEQFSAAEAACAEALRLAPDYLEAAAVLALIRFQQSRFDETRQVLEYIFSRDPQHPEALALRAQLHAATGTPEAALDDAQTALARKPGLAAAHLAAAMALRYLNQRPEAWNHIRKAADLRPYAAEVWASFGNLLLEAQRLEAAASAYRQAIALKPTLAQAHNNLGRVLFCQRDAQGAIAAFSRALVLRPDYHDADSNRVTCFNYLPDLSGADLKAEHQLWDCRHGNALLPATVATGFPNLPPPGAPLRIGYVSADFGRHPVGYFLDKVLAAHDPAVVEVILYSGRMHEDDLTQRLFHHAARVHSTLGQSNLALAQQIHNDGIAVLIDLAGHTSGNRLPVFALRPAPVQVSWLGYFATTGLKAMDAVLMDAVTVPPESEDSFCEQVIRLPHSRFCYSPPDYAPAPAPPPSLRHGYVTFGSFNNLTKLTPEVIRLWTAVVLAVPDARLRLKWQSLRDPHEQHALRQAFAAAGLPAERLDLLPDTPHADMLEEYSTLDIALDPFPFCGGLTSCEALWMGVPVLTWPGSRPVSRQTLGFLTVLGLENLLAVSSATAYIARACALAADLDKRLELRNTLRPLMAASPLCDGPGFTRRLESALLRLWQARKPEPV